MGTTRVVGEIAGALLIVVGLAQVGHAQPASAQAEVLFQQGLELIRQNKIAEACEAFEAAEKLDPTSGTLLRLADCRERNGQLATAWALFLDAERMTRPQADPEGQSRHAIAVDRGAKLAPRVSTLQVQVKAAHGLEVFRDSVAIEPGAWNRALPVDGGTYRITARAPNAKEWSASVIVGREGDKKLVEIPLLEPVAVKAPPADQSTQETAEPTDESVSEPIDAEPVPWRERMSTQRWIAVGSAGLSVLTLGVGIASGLSARSSAADARAAGCNDDLSSCPSAALDDARSAYARGNVSTTMFVASGVFAAGAVVLWLTSETGSATRRPADAWNVTPVLTPHHASVAFIREF